MVRKQATREGSREERKGGQLTVELLIAGRLFTGNFVLLGRRFVVFLVLGGFDGVCRQRGQVLKSC